MRFEKDPEIGSAQVIYDLQRSCYGLLAPRTNNTIAVIEHYWLLVAVASGIELEIYEEHPEHIERAWNRHGGDNRPVPRWFIDEGYPYLMGGMGDALIRARELYEAATAAGLPIHTSDATELQQHLNTGYFAVRDHAEPVFWVRGRVRVVKKRKMTQKRLDSGEDMTV